MAEGLLKHICENEFEIDSAGTKPSIVRPEAINVLRKSELIFPIIVQNRLMNLQTGK